MSVDGYTLLVFAHLLLFAYWLGPDWGVYVSARRVADENLSSEERQRFLHGLGCHRRRAAQCHRADHRRRFHVVLYKRLRPNQRRIRLGMVGLSLGWLALIWLTGGSVLRLIVSGWVRELTSPVDSEACRAATGSIARTYPVARWLAHSFRGTMIAIVFLGVTKPF